MSGGVLVAALGIASFILLVLFLKLGEEQEKNDNWTRYPLQIIIFGFLLGILLLLGKTGYDYKDNCAWLVNGSTVNGSQTNYQYAYSCNTNTTNTSSAFYDITVWAMRITITYLVLSFAFQFLSYLNWWNKGGKSE